MRKTLPSLVVAAGLLGTWPARPAAIDTPINDPAVSEALRLARRGGPALDAFNRRYTTIVGDPTYDRLEVITEFRRAVLTAAERLAVDSRWDLGQAKAALAPYRGLVAIVLWIKFPPQNVLVTVPDYQIVIYPKHLSELGRPEDEATLPEAGSQNVTPLYLAGGGNTFVAPPGSGMSGLRIEARIAAAGIPDDGVVTVGMRLGEDERRRTELRLSGLR